MVAKKKVKKVAKKAPEPEVKPEVKPEEESDNEDEGAVEEEQEEEEAEQEEQPEKKLETKSKRPQPKKKTKANRIEEALAADNEPRGVVYLGHIPKGFVEPQMRKFFNQFGAVTRLRMARSKKNGAVKGYGWVEFQEEDVAKVVAQAMDKYLLFGKQLQCHVVPKDHQHPALFKGHKKKMSNRSFARRREHRLSVNDRPLVEAAGAMVPQSTQRQLDSRSFKDKKLKGKLSTMGIDYDFEEDDTPKSPVKRKLLADNTEPVQKKKKLKAKA